VLTTLLTGTSADELHTRVEEAADEVLADRRVCSLAAPLPAEPPDALARRDGMSAIERHGTRYTTEATLLSEARVLDAVANGRNVESASSPSAPLTWCLTWCCRLRTRRPQPMALSLRCYVRVSSPVVGQTGTSSSVERGATENKEMVEAVSSYQRWSLS